MAGEVAIIRPTRQLPIRNFFIVHLPIFSDPGYQHPRTLCVCSLGSDYGVSGRCQAIGACFALLLHDPASTYTNTQNRSEGFRLPPDPMPSAVGFFEEQSVTGIGGHSKEVPAPLVAIELNGQTLMASLGACPLKRPE